MYKSPSVRCQGSHWSDMTHWEWKTLAFVPSLDFRTKYFTSPGGAAGSGASRTQLECVRDQPQLVAAPTHVNTLRQNMNVLPRVTVHDVDNTKQGESNVYVYTVTRSQVTPTKSPISNSKKSPVPPTPTLGSWPHVGSPNVFPEAPKTSKYQTLCSCIVITHVQLNQCCRGHVWKCMTGVAGKQAWGPLFHAARCSFVEIYACTIFFFSSLALFFFLVRWEV